MTHADIIESLGGTKAVADALSREESAVSNWKQRGIPWKVRPQIARLAKDGKLTLPPDFLVPLE